MDRWRLRESISLCLMWPDYWVILTMVHEWILCLCQAAAALCTQSNLQMTFSMSLYINSLQLHDSLLWIHHAIPLGERQREVEQEESMRKWWKSKWNLPRMNITPQSNKLQNILATLCFILVVSAWHFGNEMDISTLYAESTQIHKGPILFLLTPEYCAFKWGVVLSKSSFHLEEEGWGEGL